MGVSIVGTNGSKCKKTADGRHNDSERSHFFLQSLKHFLTRGYSSNALFLAMVSFRFSSPGSHSAYSGQYDLQPGFLLGATQYLQGIIVFLRPPISQCKRTFSFYQATPLDRKHVRCCLFVLCFLSRCIRNRNTLPFCLGSAQFL